MALMKKTQRSFAGGMLDKDLTGRQDLNKYAQGCLELVNFKVRKQGNVIKRAGTNLVCDFTHCLGNGSSDIVETAKLIPLIQERESGFYMLFTANRAFLIGPSGMKMTNGTWSQNPAWSASAGWTTSEMPEGHAVSGSPTFSNGSWTWTDGAETEWTADGTAKDVVLIFKATISSVEYTMTATLGNDTTSTNYTVPYSIAIPFNDEDLKMLDWCQSGDTVFFAHRSYAPCKIVFSGGKLEYAKLQFRQGLGTPPSIDTVTQSGTGWTGTGGEVDLEYCVTAVKDGVETGASIPYATSYNLPWPSTGSYKITIDASSIDSDDFDTFYIYKKISDVFGLIGTTSNQVSFVDISDSFSVNGSLYPTGFTEFDETVHLRDSGNKFGSVSVINNSEHTIISVHIVGTNLNGLTSRGLPYETSYGLNSWKAAINATDGDHTYTKSPTYSSTPQKQSSGTNVVFDLNQNGVQMSDFRVKIGSLLHTVNHTYTLDCQDNWYYYLHSVSTWICSKATKPVRTIYREEDVWTAAYSDFTPCQAKYFKATVEFNNGTEASPSWITSNPIDCTASVDQTALGSEWVAQSGVTSYRRTYASTEYKTSYNSAAEVIAKMDEPEVGATVKFNIPDTQTIGGTEYTLSGKKIRKITVYGYTDSTGATAADLIVNGIACYQGGKYVYSFTDENTTPDLTITPPKTEDHFVNPTEFPGCVQIYQQRLVYASSADNPFTFWMSCVGDLYNFDTHEYTRSNDAITASTAALEMPKINRMLVHRDLMMFADGGEWQVAPSSGNAVAPSTIAAKLQSAIGSAAWLKPIAVDSDIVYCDREGEALYATRYNFASDGYESSNLSVLSQRLFRNNPIQSFAYAQFPESTFECVLADGTVASLVYMKEHEVCAWSLNRLGGDWDAINVASNKSTTGGSSDVCFVATRTYLVENANTSSSTTEWAVLALRDIDPNDESLKANLRMDSVRIVTNARVNGAEQPPTAGHGETVVKIGETRTGSGELITVTADTYAIGCTFKSVLVTTSPEFTNEETAQMEIKNATEAEVRVIDGSSFTARQPEIDAAKASQMLTDPTPDTTPATFTISLKDADCKMPLVGINTWNGSILIEHSGYLPLAILSVSTAYRVEFANHANGGSKQ